MGNKTKINGTEYEIVGGKTLVDKTIYEIGESKVRVGGSEYKLLVKKAKVRTVKSRHVLIKPDTIQYSSVTINGQSYDSSSNSSEADLKLPIGHIVMCMVDASRNGINGEIYHNGTIVAQSNGTVEVTYEHPITSDTTFLIFSGGALGYDGEIHIFDNGYIMFCVLLPTTSNPFVVEYMVREGYTWDECINSNMFYQISNGYSNVSSSYTINNGFVYYGETVLKTSDGVDVKSTDVIIANEDYIV